MICGRIKYRNTFVFKIIYFEIKVEGWEPLSANSSQLSHKVISQMRHDHDSCGSDREREREGK